MNHIQTMIRTPWVQCPKIQEVTDIVNSIPIQNFYRGSKQALRRLNYLESLYRNRVKDIVDLSEFPHCYFVNGVTDAINQWVATEDRTWQYLEGDYEYANIISSKGNKVKYINNKDVLYISNPSCSTGNFIDIKDIENPVILDCAYVGSTKKQEIFVPKNTEQIWFSFSKGWALVGQRAGLVFSKYSHKSLEPMKRVEAWNYTSVEVAIQIIENFDIDTTYNMFRDLQLDICKENNLMPSDCFFIANSTDEKYAARRRTGNIARLDLSYIMNYQKEHKLRNMK